MSRRVDPPFIYSFSGEEQDRPSFYEDILFDGVEI